LPAVADGTMPDAGAVEFVDAGDVRQLVLHAGGQEELAAAPPHAAPQRDLESVLDARRVDDLSVVQLDGVVWLQLLAGDPAQLRGRQAVARQETAQPLRAAV